MSRHRFNLNGKTVITNPPVGLVVTFGPHEVSIGWPLANLTSAKQVVEHVSDDPYLADADEEMSRMVLMTMLFGLKRIHLKPKCDKKTSHSKEVVCGPTGFSDGSTKYKCLQDRTMLITGFVHPGEQIPLKEEVVFDIVRLNHINGLLQCEPDGQNPNITEASEQFLPGVCKAYQHYIMFTYELGKISDKHYMSECLDIDLEVEWYGIFQVDGSAAPSYDEGAAYISQYPLSIISDVVGRIQSQRVVFPFYTEVSPKIVVYEYEVDGTTLIPAIYGCIFFEKGTYIIDLDIDVDGSNRVNEMTIRFGDKIVFRGPVAKTSKSFKYVSNGTCITPILELERYETKAIVHHLCVQTHHIT